VKKNILLFGLLVSMSFGDATINIVGNATYAIDGRVSNSKILESGQTLTYRNGNGTIKIIDANKNEIVLPSKKSKSYMAVKPNGFISSLLAWFFVSKVNFFFNGTKGSNGCEEIEMNQIIISEDVNFVEYYQKDNYEPIAIYHVKNNKLKLIKGKNVTQPQRGDILKLKDKDDALLVCYSVKR